jgi:hypothetical protein
MRTTLTLESDVARSLAALQRKRRLPFKALVNELLRAGLEQAGRPLREPPAPYVLPALDLGRCRLPDLDNVAEVLAVAEGERAR